MMFTIGVSDAAGNELIIAIAITVESSDTPPTDTGTSTDTETRFDPFADDPLRNVPGYLVWMFSSLLLVSIVGLLWNIVQQKRKF